MHRASKMQQGFKKIPACCLKSVGKRASAPRAQKALCGGLGGSCPSDVVLKNQIFSLRAGFAEPQRGRML